MGRIGKRILAVPKGVEVKTSKQKIEVKGPKGTIARDLLHAVVRVVVEEGGVKTLCDSNAPRDRALVGTYNSLIKGMLDGVTKGFEKKLEIVGVGYRAAKQGKQLQLQIGYSNPVIIDPPAGIDIEVEGTNKVTVKGIDKQMVGEIAAQIRAVREVEPYKGKGIKYFGEKVVKKAGKAAKVAGGGAAA